MLRFFVYAAIWSAFALSFLSAFLEDTIMAYSLGRARLYGMLGFAVIGLLILIWGL